MNSLKVNHFKCFDSQLKLDLFDKKNLLLYGENGAGKSSLFEAIKFSIGIKCFLMCWE